ncbi:MAG: hypothetical protein FWE22_01245 [Firmicutes bacterium]|nr:hypothetical protein [Bacillota bacterium]
MVVDVIEEALRRADVAATEASNAQSEANAAQANANTRAPLSSPNFSGVPTAPTATAGANNTQIATTEWVRQRIINNLNSTSTNETLSANQGRILNERNSAIEASLPMRKGTLASGTYTVDRNWQVAAEWVNENINNRVFENTNIILNVSVDDGIFFPISNVIGLNSSIRLNIQNTQHFSSRIENVHIPLTINALYNSFGGPGFTNCSNVIINGNARLHNIRYTNSNVLFENAQVLVGTLNASNNSKIEFRNSILTTQVGLVTISNSDLIISPTTEIVGNLIFPNEHTGRIMDNRQGNPLDTFARKGTNGVNPIPDFIHEEGVWNPQVGAHANGFSQTFIDGGRYIRNGNLVTVFFRVMIQLPTASTLYITGLPFLGTAAWTIRSMAAGVAVSEWQQGLIVKIATGGSRNTLIIHNISNAQKEQLQTNVQWLAGSITYLTHDE